MDTQTLIILVTTAAISISSIFLFLYVNKKRQINEKKKVKLYDILSKEFESLKYEHKKLNDKEEILTQTINKLNTKEEVLTQIINCANKALEDENLFYGSMKKLVHTLRIIFQGEYCAFGIVSRDIVEDYVTDYDEYDDRELKQKQQDCFDATKKVKITDSEYMACEALTNFEQPIRYFDEEEIKNKHNKHYEYYKTILKSKKISNTTVIPLRNNDLENYGYIQFINSKNNISLDNITSFQDGLLQLAHMIIKKEENKLKHKENEEFIEDSNFIKKIITKNDDVDDLLDNIMKYLSEQFNAAIISFRIPVLNGNEREPLFYLRHCYVNPSIPNAEQIKKHYDTNRIIKNKYELGGYGKLKCCNNGDITLEKSINSDYCSHFNLNLNEQTLMMPILDIGNCECAKITQNSICTWHENPDCVDRFKKLYGLFKIRLFQNENEQVTEIAKIEEDFFIEKAKKRLSYLSGQITLILNTIVDKCENDSLRIFRESMKGQKFFKIRDFDKQFVDVIKLSTRAKECSIYRYRQDDNRSEQLYLSATTAEKILYNGRECHRDEIIQELFYSINDNKSITVRAFEKKKSRYVYNLHKIEYSKNFIELINGKNTIEDESLFLVPIIKKDEERTCLGVVVLFGKKDKNSISTSYWEQDKGLIEFIVDMYTRIAEADNERLTFLDRLGHELLTPINQLVLENDLLFNLSTMGNKVLDENTVLRQLRNNQNNCFLFKYIISDIEHIYSSSMKDINYKIELQNEPDKILLEAIALFSTDNIKPSISQMPALYMDKNRIKQVFINILKNAIRYSDFRQQIGIYYKSPEENDTGQHEIKFANYGIGILEEDKDRIFELYKRGKNATQGRASGSGMGLYIVKEIMKAHGGDCIIRNFKNPTEISLIFPKKFK